MYVLFMYEYVCVYTCIRIGIYICINVNKHMYMYKHMYIYKHICQYVHIQLCISMYIYKYINYIFIDTYI